MDDEIARLSECVGAEQIVLRALAIELIAEIAATQPNAEDWTRSFTDRLHRRIDLRTRGKPEAGGDALAEPARAAVDSIGSAAIQALRARGSSRG